MNSINKTIALIRSGAKLLLLYFKEIILKMHVFLIIRNANKVLINN